MCGHLAVGVAEAWSCHQHECLPHTYSVASTVLLELISWWGKADKKKVSLVEELYSHM